MRTVFVAIFCVFALVAFSGCGDNTTTTQQKQVVCQTIDDGTSLRIMTISSPRYYWNEKQEDVVAKLDSVVNSGNYNVVSVKTFYSDAYLTSAEVKYSIAEDCDNRNIRIKFLQSPHYYWNEKQEDVKPLLDSIVNGGTYDIFDVNTVMLQGYLVAAEVYYYQT